MNANIWDIITAIFTALVPISGWIGVWIYLRRRKKEDDILLAVATLRKEGVALRNKGLRKAFEGDELTEYASKLKNIKDTLVSKIKEYDPVQGELLDTLGEIPPDVLPRFASGVLEKASPLQLTPMVNLTETMSRAYQLITNRQPPEYEL